MSLGFPYLLSTMKNSVYYFKRPVVFLFISAAVFVFPFLGLVSGCVASEDGLNTSYDNVCEEAAKHREECTGVYITPPPCDDVAKLKAEYMLGLECDEFDEAIPDSGKADGAFCDWFGTGCTPDEEIFTGPPCSSDLDCSNGEFCVEERCFGGVTSEEFSEVLDVYTESVESWGSYTELFVENDEIRQFRKELVSNAQESIHFSALIIENNESGYEMVDLFIDAAQRGVEVRVIVDATTQYFQSDYDILSELNDAGVKAIAFNPITEWAGVRMQAEYWGLTANMRLHEKILVVDGVDAVLGGRNVGDSYLSSERWRDVDIYVTGPGVSAAQEMFLFIWNRMFEWEIASSCKSASRYGNWCPPTDKDPVWGDVYFPQQDPVTDTGTRVIHSDPYSQETANGYFTYLSLIRGARRSIKISAAYFIPPRRLRKHLRAAAERGVEVKVVTNSKDSTDSATVYYAGLNYYKELIQSGVQIYEYDGNELLHSKVMLIDYELGVVGSYNLDPRSAIDNSECMLLIRNSQSIPDLNEAIDEDIADSTLASDDISVSDMIKARASRMAEPLL